MLLKRTARSKGNPVTMVLCIIIALTAFSFCPCNYIKEESSAVGGAHMGAKSLFIPFDIPNRAPPLGGVAGCVHCGKKAEAYTLFGRSY